MAYRQNTGCAMVITSSVSPRREVPCRLLTARSENLRTAAGPGRRTCWDFEPVVAEMQSGFAQLPTRIAEFGKMG